MTKEKISEFNEKFYSIDTSLRNVIVKAVGDFERTKDEKKLCDTLTFSLGSDYYHKMADLCFEMLKVLKAESSSERDEEEVDF